MRTPDLDRLLAEIRAGRPRAVGRAVSLIENDPVLARALVTELTPDTGRAHVVGLTGSPGVGKSTVVTGLVGTLRERDLRVGVLAVDPTSPLSGGALLGDRVRMQRHTLDGEVFIRSMASRGRLGGLAAAVPQALRVFDAAGCGVVVLETVGVGQSEVEVAAHADSTVVLLAPGMGDAVQAAKAGLLEVGDVFVVNKSDRDGAHAVVRELRGMLALGQRTPEAWTPPIVSTTATEGSGLTELWAAVERHRDHGRRTGNWSARRLLRARSEVESLVWSRLRADLRLGDETSDVARQVRDGVLDPFSAADRALAGLNRRPYAERGW